MTVKPDEKDETNTEPEATEEGEAQDEESEAFTPAQQAVINKAIGAAKKKAAEEASKKAKDDAEAQAKAAAKAAEEESLIEQKKFQELADSRGAELDDVKSQQAALVVELDETKGLLEKANGALASYLESRKKELHIPDGVAALLDEKDPADQLSWLAANGKTFETAPDDGGTPNDKRPGVIPPTPRPRTKDGKPKLSDEDRAKQAPHARSFF